MTEILLTTLIKRPYVVAFLCSYLFIAIRVAGLRWTCQFLIVGYTIAFLSEFFSINYGVPYGQYFYKYANLKGEWLNNGVPVWDSVSYVFMCFAGLYVAFLALSPKLSTISHQPSTINRLKLVVLSAVFVTILDIIIDPVAHLGRFWFLGDIYYYPNPGFYFDITLANFAGWFFVSLCINSVGVFLLKFDCVCRLSKTNSVLALGLYYGIAGFGVVIAIYLNRMTLLLADLFWIALTALLIVRLRASGVNKAHSFSNR
ncbi:MAG: carotenoid biosynthesis protein [Deltaproteobacteria bacterium]|nr:carotenoid biosynthesis protein [Deltaproteobacteria bacterium]